MYSHHYLSFHEILDLLSNEQQGKHFGAIDPLAAQDEAQMAHFSGDFPSAYKKTLLACNDHYACHCSSSSSSSIVTKSKAKSKDE
jgi:hypothetical protein